VAISDLNVGFDDRFVMGIDNNNSDAWLLGATEIARQKVQQKQKFQNAQ
jgi:hypothetical protein